jgi:hypothetical protein
MGEHFIEVLGSVPVRNVDSYSGGVARCVQDRIPCEEATPSLIFFSVVVSIADIGVFALKFVETTINLVFTEVATL